MIDSRHYAVVSPRRSPVKPWISVDSSVYDSLREHGLALNPTDERSELVELLRLAVPPHGFHLAVDDLQGVSQQL